MRTWILAAAVAGLTATSAHASVTEKDVRKAQKAWGEGIVEIGKVYKKGGDYKKRASKHIKDLYAYEQGGVLFKPTLAAEDQFRETFDEALSYFVSGKVKEDKGFAIRPWSKVRWGEQEIITQGDTAVAMGNYYFTPVDSDEEQKVEFTFGYVLDKDDKLRINVHHSSLPYTP